MFPPVRQSSERVAPSMGFSHVRGYILLILASVKGKLDGEHYGLWKSQVNIDVA